MSWVISPDISIGTKSHEPPSTMLRCLSSRSNRELAAAVSWLSPRQRGTDKLLCWNLAVPARALLHRTALSTCSSGEYELSLRLVFVVLSPAFGLLDLVWDSAPFPSITIQGFYSRCQTRSRRPDEGTAENSSVQSKRISTTPSRYTQFWGVRAHIWLI